MAEIFAWSKSVLAWLGQPTAHSQETISTYLCSLSDENDNG